MQIKVQFDNKEKYRNKILWYYFYMKLFEHTYESYKPIFTNELFITAIDKDKLLSRRTNGFEWKEKSKTKAKIQLKCIFCGISNDKPQFSSF